MLSAHDLETRLREVSDRYASLVERVGYGVYRSTPEGRFVEVNSVLMSMLGYTRPEDILGLELARDVYLDPEDRMRLRERPSVVFPEWVETRWKRRDGTAITVRLSVQRIRDAEGRVIAYDGIVEDVGDRQRREELMRRSERMASLGTTLAGVAHELNNPLAAIMGFAQLLLRKPWPSEDRAALETINHEAIRSATIVKDLLALTRKRDVERRVPADINDIVGYIARTRRYALETAGIACTLDLQPSLPPIHGDRAQLEQVVLNLLNNAEQALAPRAEEGMTARIAVRTRHDGEGVFIEIEDNGPGIPEEWRSRIWDPFWTTKGEGEGTGLGLAVVHGIVSDHGGVITLEEAVGPGARFVIRLPAAAPVPVPPPVGQASRPLDVLVVDPGATDLLFVERFLTARGHAVINAGSGDLALRLAAQTTFDAVVCDARLLGRDGSPIAATLRGARGCATSRFVLSSAGPIDSDILPPSISGSAIVSRPYDVEALRRLIEGD